LWGNSFIIQTLIIFILFFFFFFFFFLKKEKKIKKLFIKINIYNLPHAIDKEPATKAATPARNIAPLLLLPPPTPSIVEEVETNPSFNPRIAALNHGAL